MPRTMLEQVDTERLLMLMAENGDRPTELAAGTGLSLSYVSKIVKGRCVGVSRPTFKRLCEFYGVPASVLRRKAVA